jgi:hypothetical protein
MWGNSEDLVFNALAEVQLINFPNRQRAPKTAFAEVSAPPNRPDR